MSHFSSIRTQIVIWAMLLITWALAWGSLQCLKTDSNQETEKCWVEAGGVIHQLVLHLTLLHKSLSSMPHAQGFGRMVQTRTPGSSIVPVPRRGHGNSLCVFPWNKLDSCSGGGSVLYLTLSEHFSYLSPYCQRVEIVSA